MKSLTLTQNEKDNLRLKKIEKAIKNKMSRLSDMALQATSDALLARDAADAAVDKLVEANINEPIVLAVIYELKHLISTAYKKSNEVSDLALIIFYVLVMNSNEN